VRQDWGGFEVLERLPSLKSFVAAIQRVHLLAGCASPRRRPRRMDCSGGEESSWFAGSARRKAPVTRRAVRQGRSSAVRFGGRPEFCRVLDEVFVCRGTGAGPGRLWDSVKISGKLHTAAAVSRSAGGGNRPRDDLLERNPGPALFVGSSVRQGPPRICPGHVAQGSTRAGVAVIPP